MLAVILDASVRAVVLAALALAVVFLARKRSAAFRHAVWTVALLGMLGMPAMTLLAPPLPIRVLEPTRAPVFLATPRPMPAIAATSAAPRPFQPRPAADWREFALAVYSVVAFALLLRLVIGRLGVRRLLRRSRPIEADVLESGEISVPLTIGSSVLLPVGWGDWDPSALRAALAHEREHVRRRDWLIGTLAAANRALFWFHPLAWWLERRLATLAEEACDDAAVLALEDRELYAGVLLEMARAAQEHGGRVIAGAPAMAHHVSRRVERILDGALKSSSGLGRTSWIALLLAALPALYGTAAARLAPLAPAELIQAAPRITESEAAALEARLVSDPDDVDARSRLIRHYFSLKTTSEAWRKHVFWLIEHHPEADIFRTCLVACAQPGSEDSARASALWARQLADHQDDVRVLLNASAALRDSDVPAAWRSLQRARELSPQHPEPVMRLAELYADAIQMEQGAGKIPGRELDASMVKKLLEQSTDALLLGTTGELLTREGSPSPSHAEFGRFLLQRALMLEPDNSRWAALPPTQQAEPERTGVRVRVGSRVQEQKLIKKVDPEYPALARQARLQGTVKFLITISPDGRVTDVKLMSGHPLLAPAAEAAVRQWEYKPTLLNGSTVTVFTQVDVPFRLDGAGPQPTSDEVQGGVIGGVPGGTPGGVPAGLRAGPVFLRVGSPVQESKLIKKVDPDYPPAARQARVQGIVRLQITISRDGHVADVKALSGHPLLVPAAREAVSQWKYRPAMLGGEPVEIVTQVDVPFNLDSATPQPTSDGVIGGVVGGVPGGTPGGVVGGVVGAVPAGDPGGVVGGVPAGSRSVPMRIRIGEEILKQKLLKRPEPVYPPLARQARVQGTVRYLVTIGTDGRVKLLRLVSGHPLLVPAAQTSILESQYSPILVNGSPVEVVAPVEINFTLPDEK